MDDPVPIEGIIEGEPESLAVVCAAGGSAIVAYCAAVGADAYVAETVVTALATFRRGVVENADQEPAQLEALLLTSTAHAARRIAGVDPSPVQQAAAQVALEGAVTGPLTPGLAPRIIRALVEAAPVTALGGDAAAVRRATEQHYIRMFDRHQAAGAAARRRPRGLPPPRRRCARPFVDRRPRPRRRPRPPPRRGRRRRRAAATQPPAADGAGSRRARRPRPAEACPNASAVTPARAVGSRVPRSRPTRSRRRRRRPGARAAPAPPDAPTIPAQRRACAPPPGALVIKRGGHWPFRRRRRGHKPSHGTWRRPACATCCSAPSPGSRSAPASPPLAMPEKERPAEHDPRAPARHAVHRGRRRLQRRAHAAGALGARRSAGSPPRPGRTWVTLAAQTRNISRPDFLPRGARLPAAHRQRVS